MIGSTVLNYRIEGLLGEGGMGSVYYATNINIDQKVAIKVLNKNLSDSTVVRDWFKNEANLLCQLNHPNIVKFLNFVENENGIFLIMEYVDGVTLEDFIVNKNGLIVEERVYELFDQILDAFAYAHKLNIVHRDIKPANIILTTGTDGEFIVKILDFGIAGFTSSINENKSWIVGTPSYMSPEQVNGEDIDQRSDIYSLGVLLHQMLTGRTPYDATTLSEVVIKDKVLKEPLPRMKDYYAYISEKLQRIVDKAVDKDKKHRYQNCSEFRRAMKHALKPEQTSNKIKIISAAIIFVLLAAGAAIWDYNRTKVYYYKDYVEQWGVPQGIGKLSSSDAKRSHRHYKFEHSKYKLQRVSHVNSLNKIIADGESERNERPWDMQLFYGDNGKISYVKVLDNNGKVLYKKTYNDKLTTVIFQYDDEYSTEKTLSAQTVGYVQSFNENVSQKGKISRWLLEYDQNGFVLKVKYAGFQNVLAGDAHGIFGRKYLRDEKGRVLEEHYLGSDDTPKATKWGMGIKKFYYDDSDNWVKSEYQTVDGNPSYDDADGIAIYKLEYNEYGNVTFVLHCESDGELMLPKKHHVAGASYVYDEKGFITELMYLGLDKKPCFIPSQGIAGYRAECDANGFYNKQTFIDTDGAVCTSSAGNAISTYMYDEKGNQLEMWTYDADNQLVETKDGYAGYKVQYDSLGNMTEYISYGVDKNPCVNNTGTVGYRASYTEFGKTSKIVNLGIDLNPCNDNDGITISISEYDKRGNRTKLTFYDETEEKLQLSNEGVAGWSSIYDENGNETERSFFDIQNNACLINNGYAKWITKYDDKGNELEVMYYDIANKLVVTSEGYAGKKYIYDERGNVIENSSIGTNGNLASGKLVVRYKYDKFDNEIEFSVFDKDNKPAINSMGYFKYVKKYNERNQEIEVCYFGKNGKPTILNGKNYSIIRYEYDNKGNSTQTSFSNTDNKPCICSEGYAIHKSEYNNLGQIIRQTYFDVTGKPTNINEFVPEGIVKYDKWGNVIYLAAGDGDGNLIINPNTGWAIMEKEFDIKGNELMVSYSDTNKKAVEPKGFGYAKSVSTYDKNSNILEQKLYSPNGELRKGKQAITKYKYDEFNRRTEIAYFNSEEKPCNSESQWHKEVYSDFIGSSSQLCKIYGVDGKMLGSYKMINGQWTPVGNTNTTQTTQTTGGDRMSVRSLVSTTTCPNKLADGIEVSKAYMQGSTGVFEFKLTEISMYNLSDADKKNYIDSFREYKNSVMTGVEKGGSVKFIINDKANRKLFEL